MTNSLQKTTTNILAGAMLCQAAYYLATKGPEPIVNGVSEAASSIFSAMANTTLTTKLLTTALVSSMATTTLILKSIGPVFR